MITPSRELALLIARHISVAIAGFVQLGCGLRRRLHAARRGVGLLSRRCVRRVDHRRAKLSWVFERSTFTNDPETGAARRTVCTRKDPVEPLDDQRLVTSSYRRMRSENRGRDGSMDTTYVVQGWGTGGGELGAEWQMFNDVWKEAILSGSFYNNEQASGPWGSGRWGGGNPNWNGGWGGGWGPALEWRLERRRLEWWQRWRLERRRRGPGSNWNQGGRRRHDDHWPSDNRRRTRRTERTACQFLKRARRDDRSCGRRLRRRFRELVDDDDRPWRGLQRTLV